MRAGLFRKIARNGDFALGFTCGFLALLLAVLLLENFDLILVRDSAFFGAIIGAVVAGAIGVVGQLLVLAQNQAVIEENRSFEIVAQLEEIYANLIRISSTFNQVKDHMESSKPFDLITFRGAEPLMKPLRINDLHKGFETKQISLAIRIGDTRLFNLINVLDGVLRNFSWSHKEYEQRADLILDKFETKGELRVIDGVVAGEADLHLLEYHILKDLMEHNRSDAYSGLVVSIKAAKMVRSILSEKYGKIVGKFKLITDEELEELTQAIDLGNYSEDVA